MQGSGAVFTGRLASDTVSPIGRRELSIRDGNGRELATVTTSEDGVFDYKHPSFDTAGSHSLTVRFSGGGDPRAPIRQYHFRGIVPNDSDHRRARDNRGGAPGRGGGFPPTGQRGRSSPGGWHRPPSRQLASGRSRYGTATGAH